MIEALQIKPLKEIRIVSESLIQESMSRLSRSKDSSDTDEEAVVNLNVGYDTTLRQSQVTLNTIGHSRLLSNSQIVTNTAKQTLKELLVPRKPKFLTAKKDENFAQSEVADEAHDMLFDKS